MKKLILILLVFAVVSGSAFAFDILSFPPSVEGGSIMIDAGLGLRYWSGLKMTIPPLFLNVEYALPVGVPISVGGGIAVDQWKFTYLWHNDYTYKVTYITPYVRANWHWGLDVKWLDLYSGLSFGANIAVIKWREDYYANIYTSSSKSSFYFAFHAGAHFYFSKYVGAVAETGYPYYLKAGIALKFGGKGGGGGSSGSSE